MASQIAKRVPITGPQLLATVSLLLLLSMRTPKFAPEAAYALVD
jgi:hypothetical protein